MVASQTFSVFAIDDHAIIAAALKIIVEATPGYRFVGGAGTVVEGLEQIEQTNPDIIVTDLIFPANTGYAILEKARTLKPPAKVIIFTALSEEVCATRCMRLGAKGLVVKGKPIEILREAIIKVAAGGVWFSEALKSQLIEQVSENRPRENATPLLCLSETELTVFRMIGSGLTTKEIAKSLCRSDKTIETYRSRIKVKLGLSNSHQLAQQAITSFMGL